MSLVFSSVMRAAGYEFRQLLVISQTTLLILRTVEFKKVTREQTIDINLRYFSPNFLALKYF